tara:strand:+ start:996 stop:1211 length:216 start_codon:yes stop_codon:yes gene_type:complete
MTKLDEIIFSYTYARIAGTRTPKNLDQKAEEILSSASKEVQNTMNVIFAVCEYEEKLRFLRHEQKKTYRKN